MSFSYTTINNINELYTIKEDWIALHAISDSPSIYNSYEFVSNSLFFLKHEHSTPFVLLVYQDSVLKGIFFMERNTEIKSKVKLQLIESTAQQEIDKPYPIIHTGCQAAMWAAFFDYLPQAGEWDVFRIYELNENKKDLILNQLSRKNTIIRINPDKYGPTIDLKQSWQEYLMKHKKMRKKINRLIKSHGDSISFKVFDNDLTALEVYKNIESKSWKSGKIGIARNFNTYRFYQGMCQSLSDSETLSMKIGILYIDNTPISAEIAYICNKDVYFCHGCYNDQYATYSPGMISTAYFIQSFMDENYHTGDFLCGYADYLKAWSDSTIKTQQIDIYNNTLSVKAFFFMRGIRKLLSYAFPRLAHDQ